MSKYLQKKFALSEQGGRDLTKAIFSCALTNMGLIFPMGILFLFMEGLLGPLVGIQAPSLGMAGYVAACIVLLVIIFIFWRIQYDYLCGILYGKRQYAYSSGGEAQNPAHVFFWKTGSGGFDHHHYGGQRVY